jgi:hypothetical protein
MEWTRGDAGKTVTPEQRLEYPIPMMLKDTMNYCISYRDDSLQIKKVIMRQRLLCGAVSGQE